MSFVLTMAAIPSPTQGVWQLGIWTLGLALLLVVADLRLVFLGAAAYVVFASRSTAREVATPPAESAAVRTGPA